MNLIQGLATRWYAMLSQVSAALTAPIADLADRIEWPLVTVFLFGLVGAVSPCQLTTNLSAMAYVGSRVGATRPWPEALAYVLGKVLVYTALGAAAVAIGRELQAAAIPVAVTARKVLGPLMIVIGLGFLGVLRLRGSVGQRASAWLQARLPHGGVLRAFLLGVAFSFTFCPTLFWLFFGLTIPLALRSAGGWTFPGLFAVGTVVPLLAFTALLVIGTDLAQGFVTRVKRSHRLIGRTAGAIFVLAGIHDTLTYWML